MGNYTLKSDLQKAVDRGRKILHRMSKEEFSKVSYISERNKDMLVLKFGLFGNAKQTLSNIAQQYGISAERVRQIVIKCLINIDKIETRGYDEVLIRPSKNKSARELIEGLKEFYEGE